MTADLSITPEEAITRAGETVFGDAVFPVRAPDKADSYPLLVYAVTGDAHETVFGGQVRTATSFRLEIHARKYADISEKDAELIAALRATERLTNLLSVLDDYSGGVQPVQQTGFGQVSVEEADNVYRRIRTVQIH